VTSLRRGGMKWRHWDVLEWSDVTESWCNEGMTSLRRGGMKRWRHWDVVEWSDVTKTRWNEVMSLRRGKMKWWRHWINEHQTIEVTSLSRGGMNWWRHWNVVEWSDDDTETWCKEVTSLRRGGKRKTWGCLINRQLRTCSSSLNGCHDYTIGIFILKPTSRSSPLWIESKDYKQVNGAKYISIAYSASYSLVNLQTPTKNHTH